MITSPLRLALFSVVLPLPSVAFAQRDPNSFTSLGTLSATTSGTTLTINTDTLTMSGTALGSPFAGTSIGQPNGPSAAVFTFSNITIGSGVTVNVTGLRPLILLSRGTASITTSINVDGNPFGLSTPGVGG